MSKSRSVVIFICIFISIMSESIWAVDMMNSVLQSDLAMRTAITMNKNKQGSSKRSGISNQLAPLPEFRDQIAEIQSLAAQGYLDAQVNLGAFYRGIGDEIEATKWFALAAERGHSKAQVFLGNRYLYGIGAPKNQALAEFWLLKAADQGEQTASDALLSRTVEQAKQEATDVIKAMNQSIK